MSYNNQIEEDVDLYIDVETYSSVNITESGAYAYTESPDFEIIILCYAIGDGDIKTVDLLGGDSMPYEFIYLMNSPGCRKHAHNAAFERLCFQAIGMNTNIDEWYCSAVKAAYCGLPLSLDGVSKAMKLGEAAKDAEGKALIKYFSVPVKPTKVNGGRTRNLPHHNPEKWEKYKAYCKQDVHAERTILNRLYKYNIPSFEHDLYVLDQEINDRGIKVDLTMASNACYIDNENAYHNIERLKEITNVPNPNSDAQLKQWLSVEMQKDIKSLSKDIMPDLIKEAGAGTIAEEVLNLRSKNSKTSTTKYSAMISCACEDGRAHGLFQFYGANRTGRWAGRLIQLQNLPRNEIKDLDLARSLVRAGKYDDMVISYDDVSSILSQLVRTAFIPEPGKIFAVADFSAIEARVIAWLASEDWRLEVFSSHGMIYEASASMMFNVPIESIVYKDANGNKQHGENYSMRAKGKVAELALGYQGALGAMVKMGGEKMGLSNSEMESIVEKWREANPAIVALWKNIERNAIIAVKTGREKISRFRNIKFNYDLDVLTITLPSGRQLFYQKPMIGINKWGKDCLYYSGMDQVKKTWGRVDTYGGKLVENIVQAIARDLLAESLIKLDRAGFYIVMHVHDEAVIEVSTQNANSQLDKICAIMSEPVAWAEGLNLGADGYVTEYYKKE